MRVVATFVVAMLLGLPHTANALTAGEVVRDHVAIGGKRIPLPLGDWLVAGLGVQDFDLPELGAFGAINNVVLLQQAGGRVVAMAEINTNAVAVNDGWGRASACKTGQRLHRVTRYRTGWETSCFFVQATSAPANAAGPPAWDGARRLAAITRLTLPELWLTTGFRISDRQDLIDIRLHFLPELLLGGGSVGSAAPWTEAAVRTNAAQLNAIQLLATWAAGFEGVITSGLRNRLPATVVDMPQLAPFVSAEPQIDTKLLALEQLYRSGAIDRAAYRLQARQALDEIPELVEQVSVLPRSVQKNISFRVFGSTVDYALAFIVTHNSPLSAWITATIVTVHSFIFVANDNYWEDYWARHTTRDAERTVDFVYIGAPL